jgi:competence protein ComEC
VARENPLLLPFLAFALGVYGSTLTEFAISETAAAGIAMIAIAVLARRFVSARASEWALVAAFAAGGVLTAVVRRADPPPVIDYAPGETLLFTACVVEPPVFSGGRQSFIAEPAPNARARINVYLKPDQAAPQLHYGQRVEFEARVRKPRNFENPGGFDYVTFLARQNIFWNLSVSSSSPLRVLPGDCGSRVSAGLFQLRSKAIERLDSVFAGDRFTLGMTRAVLLGDDSRLEKVWTEDFRRTGTYHALVISGLHLTTLAGCLLFLMRVCSLGPTWSLALTGIAAWTYALMAGGETPVTRAAAGLTLFLIARWFFRKPRLLNVLAAAGFLFLIADPLQLFDASFHLSFLSVAMIGGFAIPLLDRISTPYARGLRNLGDQRSDASRDPTQAAFRLEMRLLAETLSAVTRLPSRMSHAVLYMVGRAVFFLTDLLAVSAIIQIGLVLPMIVYFHRISLSGLSANLLVVPLTNAAVPIGFLAILTGWTPLGRATGWLLSTSHSIVEWHAALEPANRVPGPPAWLSWLFLASLLVAALAIASGNRWKAAVAVGAVAAALALMVWHPFTPDVHAGHLEVTAIDVGQGDSVLVAAPDGKLMVVDGGGFPVFGGRAKPALDIGEDVVSPYLWSRSIRRVHVLVATHAHEDHIGGLRALIDNFRPAELWTGALGEDAAWLSLRRHAALNGVRLRSPRAGERFTWGGVSLEVLSPPNELESVGRGRNNDSLVLRLTYGSTSFLLTGDIEQAVERRLLADDALRRADVLKVAHHGSRSSTTELFLQAVQPTFAVISDGYENIYRFPHPAVLDRLADANATVWRTDMHGLVSIVSDGRRISAEWHRRAGSERVLPALLLD